MKRNGNANRKLGLRRETVRMLNALDLTGAAGGYPTASTDITACWCRTDNCTVTCRTNCMASVCVDCGGHA